LTPPRDRRTIDPITIHSVIDGHDPAREPSRAFFLSPPLSQVEGTESTG